MDSVAGIADEADDIALMQALMCHVGRIDKQDRPRSFEPTQTIAKAVDGGVELIVRPQRDQVIAPWGVADAESRHDIGVGERGFATFRLPEALAGLIPSIKATFRVLTPLYCQTFVR